jgi:hypothetical protein
MYYPEGIDLVLRNGSNVLDALLSVPFQLVFPVPVSVVITTLVILLGNGLSILPLLRVAAPTRPIARWAVATWWMLNPWVLGEIDCGRPTQALLWFLPSAVLAMWRLGSTRDAVVLGVCTGLQGLAYWYVPFFMAVLLFPLALERLLRDGKPALVRLSVAVAVAVVTVAPQAWPIVNATFHNEIPGLDEAWPTTMLYQSNALRSITTGMLHWKAAGLAALAAVFARWRRDPWMLACVVLSFWFASGLSFGWGQWQVDNLPYIWLYEHVSFLSRLNFPERCFGVTYAVLALALALALDKSSSKLLPWLLVFLTVVEPHHRGLLPLRAKLAAKSPATVMIEHAPGPVLVTPLKSIDNALVQQIYHHQPLVSGMADHIPTVRTEAFSKLLASNAFIAAVLFQSGDTPRWSTRDLDAAKTLFHWVWFDKELQTESNGEPSVKLALDRLNQYLGVPYFEDETTVLWDITRKGQRSSADEEVEANAIRTELGTRHSDFERADPLLPAIETPLGTQQNAGIAAPNRHDRQAEEDEAAAEARDRANGHALH